MGGRVRLLGPVDIWSDGEVLQVPGVRRKAVLAVLALHTGEVVGLDHLIDIVWDGRPPGTATNTLQRHVSYLRRELGTPGAIVARTPGYVLQLGTEPTDVRQAESLIERGMSATDPGERMRRLKAALDLWRGRPLADVAGSPWFAAQAARLDRVRRRANLALGETRLALGRHGELVPELEGLLEPYPFDEELHRLLMVALYRCGRQADALGVVHGLRDRLREELGIDPSAAVRDLETAILRQDPGLDLVPGDITAARHGTPLVERAAETKVIGHALERASDGAGGGLVLVEGPAGMGKTSLLGHARDTAEAMGFTVATARGTDLEVDNGWGCVRQLFERFARQPGSPASAAVVRVTNADPSMPQGEYAIIDSLFWLAADLAAANPLLIVVDDLHWADAASAQFLAYLGARLDGLAVVVLLASRPGADRLGRITSIIAGLPLATTITPAPLTVEGCAVLLGESPEGERALRCHEATRGNPFLVRQLRDNPGGSLACFVAGQLRHLPALAGSALRALAVLGDDVDGRALAAVSGIPAHEVMDAVAALVANDLVEARGVPARFTFCHPLIRQAVYEGIRPSTLIGLHMAAVRAALTDRDAIRAATHLLRIPPGTGGRDTVELLLRAADLSLARGSVDGAVAFLRRALDEDLGERRLTVLTRLGLAEALVDMPRSLQHLAEVLELEPDPERRAEIALTIGCTTWMTSRPRQAARGCQAVLDREPRLSEGARQALTACIGMAGYGTPHGADLVGMLDELGTRPTGSSFGGLMLEACLALNDAMKCRRERTERRALRVLAEERMVGQLQAVPLLTCAWYALGPCDSPRILPSVEAVLQHSREAGSLRGVAPAFTYRSMIMLMKGHLEDAVRDGWLAMEAATNSGVDLGIVFAGNWLIAALLARGDTGAAQTVLRQVKAAHGPELSRHIYATGELNLLLAQGQARQALRLAQETREHCATMGITNPELLDWREPLARALTMLGRADEARSAAQDLLAAARQWGTGRAIGRALRVAATTEPAPRRLEPLTESVRLLERTDARLDHAASRYLLGETLRETGHVTRAHAHLQCARDLAALCGAVPLEEAALAALRRMDHR
ncbi:BTAD domain-containing putative transcriptional regulator [Nonomuraea endophytica]|uniref:BTAD domain-containing putative transcriptional regulator n=1 Tax=Nonomuraea endophytica TaxID=714136 RepID=UPI0037C7A45C